MKNAFIRFLNLKHAAEINTEELDLTSLHLLEVCMLRCHFGNCMTVTEAMQLNKIASPATIHRKLNHLVELQYLTLEFEGKNRRTKYLTPTSKSHEYFSKMGDLLKDDHQLG